MNFDTETDFGGLTTAAESESAKTERSSLFRRPALNALRKFDQGGLMLRLPDGEQLHFGAQGGEADAQIIVRNEDFFRRCALHGGVGFGEAYVAGDWDTGDLRAVVEWFIHNIAARPEMKNSSQRFRGLGLLRSIDKLIHRMRPNSVRNSRRNIAQHYDLGNDFYKLWLDPTMTYSAARFSSAEQSHESAQVAKYEALCQKLQLREGDRVLEIGCGWGGFSMHAAREHGCHVTAVTISQAQYDEAQKRIAAAGLGDQIDLRLQDYREIEGRFDKIASIEMIEAVGDRYIDRFFAQCDRLLAGDGLLALQMITVADAEYKDLRRGTDFIQKHIFPGSLLPSLDRINRALRKTGELFLHELEDMTPDYARTLSLWHDSFNNELPAVRDLGYPEEFIRKWNYYLKYCEAAFATRNINCVQAVYSRPRNRSVR